MIFKRIPSIDILSIAREVARRPMQKDLADDRSTLVQVKAWCRQATSNYLSQCWPISKSPFASLTHNELKVRHPDILRTWSFISWWNIFCVTGPLCGEFTGSPNKGQWRGALLFSLICVWINGWVNNYEAGDLRRHRGHYDVIVMFSCEIPNLTWGMQQRGGYLSESITAAKWSSTWTLWQGVSPKMHVKCLLRSLYL